MTNPLAASLSLRPLTDGRRLLPAAALALLLAACAPAAEDAGDGAAETAAEPTPAAEPAAQAAPVPPFAAAVEQAHGAAAWRSHGAFAADVALTFGGNPMYDGSITMTPDAGRTRLERADGAVLVFDGETAWVSPADAVWPMARFHALTWAYFAAAPFKLADPGTHLEPLGERTLFGSPHETARLTFDAGVGDSPDDWYLLYRDTSGRLAAMAYIVTFGTTAEEAGKEPHAIVYEEFVDVEGALVPTRWRFLNWSEELGPHGDALGQLELSNPRFVEPAADAFTAPEGAREEALPAAPADEPAAE